jgi:SAM-dependent methyltransferase
VTRDRDTVVAANREAWNEAAPVHGARNLEALLAAFSVPGHSCLDAAATARWQALGVAGKDVAHLCCNNGQELISVKVLGAGRCVGFDNAECFLEQGRAIAAAAGAEIEFVHGDVHRLPAAYDAGFDIAAVTIGALCWFPKLHDFFAVAARLLRPGGCIFVHEQHPVVGMFEPFDDVDPPRWHYSYFKEDPWIDTDGLDYFDGQSYQSKPAYTFPHTLSEIFMGCIDNGLAIERFDELPRDLSPSHSHLERLEAKLPLSFILIVRKAAPKKAVP